MNSDLDERSQGRLEAGIRRLPPEAWPFILIAALVFAVNAREIVGAGLEVRSSFVILASILVGPLLPVAVIVGCRDAWNSARPILVGAVIWTAIGPVLSLISAVTRFVVPETWPDTPVSDAMGAIRAAGTLISLVGPALILYGLTLRRRTEATWPVSLVVPAVAATAALSFFEFSTTGPSFDAALAGFYGDELLSVTSQLETAVRVARPVEYLAVAAVAWSSLSALRAGEIPRRFWQWVVAGSALLVACDVGIAAVSLITNLRPEPADSLNELTFVVGPLGIVAAYVLLLVGFGSGLPAAPDEFG